MKELLLLAVLLLVIPASLNAQEATHPSTTSSAVEGELVALTNAWTGAIYTKNRSKLEELMAPDFALQGWDGSWRVERAEWLKNLFSRFDIAEYHHSAIVAHVYGDVAAITSKWCDLVPPHLMPLLGHSPTPL